MKKSINSKSAITILMLVAACVAFSFWLYNAGNTDDQATNTGEITTQLGDEQGMISADNLLSNMNSVPEDWNTFTDESDAFSLRYPYGYQAEKFQSTNNPPGYVELTSTNKCHPITLTKYVNASNIAQVGDLLLFEGRLDEVFFQAHHLSYHYRDAKEREINGYPFIFSESMPYVIAAATVTNDWVIEIRTTDQYGGTYVKEQCRELFLKSLSTFTLLK